MIRTLFLCVCAVLLSSCTQRMICPAYQSAFIYDKPTQKETFVYFNENKNQPREIVASNSKTITLPARDSTWSKSVVLPGPSLPKERRVKKDRYLLLPDKTYKKALRALQTVAMKPVYPKKDTLEMSHLVEGAETDSVNVALDSASSKLKIKGDSIYVISKEKEKFNLDQDNYMWYFRDILVLPDVRLAIEGKNEHESSTKTKSSSKKKGGFFKNLFKKKPKSDSTNVQPESINSTDSTSTEVPKQRRGLGGLLKKRTKVDPANTPKKKDPAKKEDDGDGF